MTNYCDKCGAEIYYGDICSDCTYGEGSEQIVITIERD